MFFVFFLRKSARASIYSFIFFYLYPLDWVEAQGLPQSALSSDCIIAYLRYSLTWQPDVLHTLMERGAFKPQPVWAQAAPARWDWDALRRRGQKCAPVKGSKGHNGDWHWYLRHPKNNPSVPMWFPLFWETISQKSHFCHTVCFDSRRR